MRTNRPKLWNVFSYEHRNLGGGKQMHFPDKIISLFKSRQGSDPHISNVAWVFDKIIDRYQASFINFAFKKRQLLSDFNFSE